MPTAGPPHLEQVVLAIVAVLAGGLVAIAAAISGWRRHNWLAYLIAVGAAIFVLGVVGQRAFPSAEAVRRLGASAAKVSTPGPFDAGVNIPVVGLQITPLALAGILAAALGVSLVLLFESSAEPRPGPRALRALEDDDTV